MAKFFLEINCAKETGDDVKFRQENFECDTLQDAVRIILTYKGWQKFEPVSYLIMSMDDLLDFEE